MTPRPSRRAADATALVAAMGFLAMLAPGAPLTAAPIPDTEVTLHDPGGDDTGPGTYVSPAVEGLRRGVFDLRQVRLRTTDAGVEIHVLMGAPAEPVRIRTSVAQQTREVFLPVIDLYVTDPARVGEGRTALLPGRRVAVSDPRGWDRAVVVSAVPEILEAHYRKTVPGLAAATCFPRGVSRSGRSFTIHVPRTCLPMDLPKAGFLVVVTGLGPGGGFQGMARRGSEGPSPDDPDPWVRGVEPIVGNCNVWEDGLGASPCSFGGCDPCGSHPLVLDAVVPPDQDQAVLLKAYEPGTHRLAALPFVWPGGVPSAQAPGAADADPAGDRAGLPAGEPSYRVANVRGEQVTVRLPSDESGRAFPAGTLGALVCPDGRPGGTVVVRGAAAGYLVLDRVPDGRPVCMDAAVLF